MYVGKYQLEIWWDYVNKSWPFVHLQATRVQVGDIHSEPHFKVASMFRYRHETHDDVHQRRVEGFGPGDLAEALDSLPPEI